MTRVPVTILTGFLGAGKTTLLNRLIIEQGFSDTAVIVNEFGEAGVDGALVAKSNERAFAMTEGCLCCTVSGDVRQTLLQLLDEAERGVGPSFDRVIIETTGLADPVPLLQTFMTNAEMLSRYTLNGVVTLVDAVNGEEWIDRFPEAQRQIAVADLLIVTKSDLARDPASMRDLQRLRKTLSQRNPNAGLKNAADVSAERIFSLAAFDPAGKPPDVGEWLRFETPHDAHQSHDHHHDHHHHGDDRDHHHHHHHDVNNHGATASAFCFTAVEPVDVSALDAGLLALQDKLGSDLLRMKGLIELQNYPGCPRVVHVAGHLTSPPRLLDGWPEGIDQTRIVMIVSGSDRSAAAELFQSFMPELRSYH